MQSHQPQFKEGTKNLLWACSSILRGECKGISNHEGQRLLTTLNLETYTLQETCKFMQSNKDYQRLSTYKLAIIFI
jgi:hypothetical protein